MQSAEVGKAPKTGIRRIPGIRVPMRCVVCLIALPCLALPWRLPRAGVYMWTSMGAKTTPQFITPISTGIPSGSATPITCPVPSATSKKMQVLHACVLLGVW